MKQLKKFKLTIEHDSDIECPNEWGGWQLYSFCNRHSSFKHPDEFNIEGIGMQRKLNCNTAFLLSYFEHGMCSWSLSGCGPQCRWDTVNRAGILVWRDDVKDLPKSMDLRVKSAASFLETYTDWCNGNCYWYNLVELIPCDACGHEEEEDVDSCGGFTGSGHLEAELSEVLKFHQVRESQVTLAGLEGFNFKFFGAPGCFGGPQTAAVLKCEYCQYEDACCKQYDTNKAAEPEAETPLIDYKYDPAKGPPQMPTDPNPKIVLLSKKEIEQAEGRMDRNCRVDDLHMKKLYIPPKVPDCLGKRDTQDPKKCMACLWSIGCHRIDKK